MKFIALLAATAALGTPSTLSTAKSDQHIVKYGCNDIVVIGRLNNVEDSYEHIDIEDDIFGHGWITAKVSIRRVLRGRETRRSLQARYFAHTYRVEDRDFLMVLTPVGGGNYTAHSFTLTPGPKRPTLVSVCAPT